MKSESKTVKKGKSRLVAWRVHATKLSNCCRRAEHLNDVPIITFSVYLVELNESPLNFKYGIYK